MRMHDLDRDGRLLPVAAVARRLDCSVSHVYRMIASGDLVAVKVGRRKGYRIQEESLGEFLGSTMVEPEKK